MAKNIKSKPLAQSFKMTKEADEDAILFLFLIIKKEI
jgi:hypothetical protein